MRELGNRRKGGGEDVIYFTVGTTKPNLEEIDAWAERIDISRSAFARRAIKRYIRWLAAQEAENQPHTSHRSDGQDGQEHQQET